MKKNEIFSKLKDYNNQLEKVLEDKDFSSDIRNILLDMLYKIETAYKDYTIVKRDTEPKTELVESITNNIKENCKEIILLDPRSEQKCIINKKEKSIEVFPNEKYMLYSIIKVSQKDINYVDTIKKAVATLLNEGNNIAKTEIIRNFNGWSWEPDYLNMLNISANIIYQNIQLLLGREYLTEWIKSSNIKELENTLTNKYEKELAEEFTKKLIELSIALSAMLDETIKEEISKNYKNAQIEFKKMDNKEEFLKEISNQKKKTIKVINYIDKCLNDKELLRKEYNTRNAKLPLKEKIFSLSHLENMLIDSRNKELVKLKQYNMFLDPINYVKKKEKLENLIEKYSNINLKESEINNKLIEFQKTYLQLIKIKIKKENSKKELLDLIYQLRYYNLLEFNKKQLIRDVKELENEIEKTGKLLITKACNTEILRIFSQNTEYNYEIIKAILNTRTILIENIELVIKNKESKLIMQIYDNDLSEIQSEVELKSKKEDLRIKLNKKYKIFE